MTIQFRKDTTPQSNHGLGVFLVKALPPAEIKIDEQLYHAIKNKFWKTGSICSMETALRNQVIYIHGTKKVNLAYPCKEYRISGRRLVQRTHANDSNDKTDTFYKVSGL